MQESNVNDKSSYKMDSLFTDFLLNTKFDYELSSLVKNDSFKESFCYSSFEDAEKVFLECSKIGSVVKIGYPKDLKVGWVHKIGDDIFKHIVSIGLCKQTP